VFKSRAKRDNPADGRNFMEVSVTEAKYKLSKLIKAVEKGKAVTICRNGVPVVDLVLSKENDREKPRFGTLRDRVIIRDPNWWKPMADENLDTFLN